MLSGAYAGAFLGGHFGIHDFAALLGLSTLISAIAGGVFGLFLVRYRAIFFAMLNLAVSMVVFALLSKLYGLTGGSDGMRVAQPLVFGTLLAPAQFAQVLFYSSLALMLGVGVLMQLYLQEPARSRALGGAFE